MDGLLHALAAFLEEHRRCGDLDGDVDEDPAAADVVWLSCSCGARLMRVVAAASP
jgi:hypothetical protein